MAEEKEHTVHVYAVVRFPIKGVRAALPREAAAKAIDSFGYEVAMDMIRRGECEPADQVTAAVVDPILPDGATDYDGSRDYDVTGEGPNDGLEPRWDGPIAARCYSDDHVAEAAFDARPWFKKASDEDIIELAKCEWGGDYPADSVAQWCRSVGNVQRMFDYVAARKDIGYECCVESESAIEWLKEHRPAVARRIMELELA